MKKLILIFFISISFLTSCQTLKIFKSKNSGEKEVSVVSGNILVNNYTITVVGKGIPPEGEENSSRGKLLAERAAIIDGYRLLSEKIAGILLRASSQNENFALTKDKIQSSTETYIKGAKIIDIAHKDNGIVEVKISLNFSSNLRSN